MANRFRKEQNAPRPPGWAPQPTNPSNPGQASERGGRVEQATAAPGEKRLIDSDGGWGREIPTLAGAFDEFDVRIKQLETKVAALSVLARDHETALTGMGVHFVEKP